MQNPQKRHKRKLRLNKLSAQIMASGLAFGLYFLVIIVALAIFGGCAKVIEKEVLVPYEVSVPVPMKCAYEMPREIKPELNTMQGVYNSLLEILKRDKELRESLRQIPCLELQ